MPTEIPTKMMRMASARFIASCNGDKDLLEARLPEIAIVGRSNCGKSSLINGLTGQNKLARTSSTPGCTRQINFFEIRFAATGYFWLVDLPGYGYAKVSKTERDHWDKIITDYIEHRSTLCALILLADIRREMTAEEQNMLKWATQRSLNIIVVLTKGDQVPKNQRFAYQQKAQKALDLKRLPLITSTDDKDSFGYVRQEIMYALPPQTTSPLDRTPTPV